MNINIITEERAHSWILRRAASEIQLGDPKRIALNSNPQGKINYCVNYALYGKCAEVDGIKIGHFTHLEKAGVFRARFLNMISKFDYFTTACKLTTDILVKQGADPNRMLRVPYGSDDRIRPTNIYGSPIMFGVVGRTYPSGRKCEWLVKEMVQAGYQVRSWGRGWPCKEMFKGSPWERIPEFYRAIDFLVITANNESGPVPVVDAIRAGVPVIAPNVGLCWEYPVIRYEKESWKSLSGILTKLTQPPTWEQWTAAHLKFFERIRSWQ